MIRVTAWSARKCLSGALFCVFFVNELWYDGNEVIEEHGCQGTAYAITPGAHNHRRVEKLYVAPRALNGVGRRRVGRYQSGSY